MDMTSCAADSHRTHQRRAGRAAATAALCADSPQSLADLFAALDRVQRACEAVSAAYATGRLTIDTNYPGVQPAPGVNLVETITYLHSAQVPAISLANLARAILKTTPAVDVTTCLISVALMKRHAAVTGLPTTAHMMHRCFIAGILVGAKSTQDSFPSNALLAKTSGISLPELNRLESTLLRDIDWRTQVQQSDLAHAAGLTSGAACSKAVPFDGADGRSERRDSNESTLSHWLPSDAAGVSCQQQDMDVDVHAV